MRFAELADTARANGRASAADRYLLLAWAAYDDPDTLFGLEDEDASADILPFPGRD